MFPFSNMKVGEGDMYEQDHPNQHDHQVKKINGDPSIVGDDQLMGSRSVEEKINDKQENLPTKSDLGQIRELNENEFGPEHNMES